jgi:hypothetical protein
MLADGREVMVLATFGMPDGRYCREFEVVDTSAGRADFAIGCHGNDGWVVEVAIAEVTDPALNPGFVPAGDAEIDALSRFLNRAGAPAVLDPAAEAEAIRQGWSAR